MSILRKIQDATVNPEFRLADVLRMCKILAARLENPAFKDWINQELNGYDNPKKLPDYRVLRGLGCCGDFFGPFGSGLKNAHIPMLSLPECFREQISTANMCQGVSAIESVVDQANQNNKSILKSPWNADGVAWLGRRNIYERMVCGDAWTNIPTAALVSILDTVKSRILDFVLAIETESPDAGESEPMENPLPEGTVNYIFDRCILNHNNQTAFSGAVIHTSNQGKYMSENYVNNLPGANVGNMANTVKDNARQQANQHIHLSESKKTLAEAAAEIQQILEKLEKTQPIATQLEMVAYVNDETTPSFKRRAASALQASGETAIDEFILENKYLKVAKAAIKGWLQPSN